MISLALTSGDVALLDLDGNVHKVSRSSIEGTLRGVQITLDGNRVFIGSDTELFATLTELFAGILQASSTQERELSQLHRSIDNGQIGFADHHAQRKALQARRETDSQNGDAS